ncbi:c-type cytochrome biogenesis protein CcmI [Hyphococcus sp.]|uniref:c-type cytochrome biogenesis protein CcmI n=1 Tax=Hyphococcus sp. TaxID=2038636 RepID=UPI00208232F5|nr:MAG: hypothetical protein DHS20C04_15100 [Marinicaulis sp.]
MIWVLIILLAIVVLFMLVEPFFRVQKIADSLDEEDYLASQIADIAYDHEAGLINAEDAAAADLEARRRLLAAHRAANKPAPARTGAAARQLSAMLVAVAPVAAVALYLLLGNSAGKETAEAQQIAAAMQSQSAMQAASLSESIAALEARLEKDPSVLDDWVLLAESYANADRFSDAARAFARARALAPGEAYLHAAEGESIAMVAGGIVTPDARFAFGQALAIDPTEPRARFYLALGAYQDGRREDALASLKQLERDAPPGVGWLPIVRSQIELISGELGQPVTGSAESVSKAATLEAEIAAGDAPYQSWIALIDAYNADVAPDKARETVARAKERYAGAPFVLQEIAKAEARLGETNAPAQRGPTGEQIQAAQSMSEADRKQMIEGMVAGLAARLEDEPNDLEGWTMLARSYGVLNQYAKSAAAYTRASDLAPDNLDLRIGRAEALLNALNADGKPIDDQAEKAITDIAVLDPEHPFALYFQGLAASQRGETTKAREFWTKLVEIMPPDSTEAAGIQSLIDEL